MTADTTGVPPVIAKSIGQITNAFYRLEEATIISDGDGGRLCRDRAKDWEKPAASAPRPNSDVTVITSRSQIAMHGERSEPISMEAFNEMEKGLEICRYDHAIAKGRRI